MAGRHVLIIANPTSGRGRGRKTAESLSSDLRRRGCTVTLHHTSAGGEAERIAHESSLRDNHRPDCIVACGGDGTMQEVANALASLRPTLCDSCPEMGLAPAGRCNDFARVLGVSTDPAHMAEVLTEDALVRYLEGFYKKADRWDYLVAGAFPGFHDIYEEAGVGSSYGYLNPQDGETFRLTLEMALAHRPDVIQLITWNDYGEGTIIEPTEEFGTRYLEMVQHVRSETDSAPFPFKPEHLALPVQLLDARRRYQDDDAANAQLDAVFTALIAGAPDEAAAILAKLSGAP